MKIHKKVVLGLLTFTMASAFMFVFSGKGFAVEVENFTRPLGGYEITTFKNNKPETVRVTIEGQYENNPTRPFKETLTFRDRNPGDNTLNLTFESSSAGDRTVLCQPRLNIGYSLPPRERTNELGFYGAVLKDLNFAQNPNSCIPIEHEDEVAILDGLVYRLSLAGAPSPTGTTTQTGDDEGSCADNSGAFGFAWAACPLLIAAQDFTNILIDQFESLLSFTIPQNPTGDDGMAQVKQSWTIFRTLASALLVVVLLVVVISQAIGGTFLDAYSVRKMLPKIVIAVIAMQLSWSLIVWIVGLVDDLGRGLADLMYQPFHGASQMSLGALLDHANIGAGQQAAINWVAIMGGLVLGAAALPTMLVFLFTAALGLLVGFVTLILRKLIIILTLIFVPVALILWILPSNGTQRLWKMWLDNFTKALLMFPLVVMLVASGRILAYIAGTQGNGTFLNLLIILVGFFGPLFILPKAFKWGGSAMQFAGNMATNVTKPVAEKGGAGLKGIGERWQGKRAKAYNPEAGLASRTARRIQSGHMIPFSKRSQRLAIAEGDKWSQERDDEALALIKRKGEKVMKDGYMTTLRDDSGKLVRVRKDAQGNMLDEEGKTTQDAREAALFKRDAAGNMLDKSGKVTTDKKKAAYETTENEAETGTRELTGVAAMKQMWVDLAETGRDDHEKKMAIRQLTATSSWPEVQGSFTKSGKRVIDTDAWAPSITTSPEDYPRVLRSRVDAAPHIVDGSERALAQEIQRRAQDPKGRPMSEVEQRDFKSAYRINYAIESQMSNEDFATQSEGFWQEAARVGGMKNEKGEYTEEAKKIQANLQKRFAAIQSAGPTVRQQMLGHLVGGSVEGEVNEALGGIDVKTYLGNKPGPAGEGGTPDAGGPTPGSPPPPSGGAPESNEIRIEHDSPSSSSPPGSTVEPESPAPQRDIPPEDFGPEGRFPPPNIPPGPGNV